MKESIKADGWLLILTMIWGLSFTLVKTAILDVSPILFLAIRFWIGSVLLVPFLLLKKSHMEKNVLYRGVILGLFTFSGMILQTLGQKYTTA